ncbi:MAG: glycosyl transferase [Chloroflexales bacterium]|nr:glycosyl transferase [Chloroflexales bacterium]
MVERQAGAGAAPRRVALSWTWQRAALISLAALALLLAMVNLPYAPRTWFDEGSHLHVPKTLLQHGVYADISSEGYRYYGPTVGVGPTVMLPVAASFQVFGVGLTQGRIVIVAYLLVALAAGYALARRLHGAPVALLALLLLLASRTLRFEGLVEYGRQVLGEVPGITLLFLGSLAWTWALAERRAWWRAGLAGLLFGLALITKNQFVLIVPLALALAALLDWRYYRVGGWALRLLPFAVACACFGAWTLVQLQFLGPGSFAANLAQTRRAAGGAIFVFDPAATGRAVRYLVQPFGALLLPAIAYGLWRCRARTPAALAELPAVLIPALWICWYVVSLGWPRYALPAVAFGALATARLLADLFAWLRARGRPALAWAVALYAVVVIAIPLALTTRVVAGPDDSAQRMAAYLDANVPADVIVETWEPELGALTDHRYHYPPIELLDTAVRETWMAGPTLAYDGLDQRPAYVVVGPFGGWVGIYPTAILEGAYRVAYSAGPYTLYARTAP